MTTVRVPGAEGVLAGRRVIPTVSVEPSRAVDLARALLEGGITIMEVLLRPSSAVAPALDSVRRVVAQLPEMTVGVGTVATEEQLDAAEGAGAAFAVSPGFSPDLAARCGELGLPYLPGVLTPTEITTARTAGLRTMKLFPARVVGLAGLDALAAAFDDVRFVPTGGIDAGNVSAWLAHPAVVAAGGSWIAPSRLVEAGDWGAITANAIEAARG